MFRMRPRAVAIALALLAIATLLLLADWGPADSGTVSRSVSWLARGPASALSILAVGAVFSQRSRWKPMKAFVVDERNQLLREFTLDPSCTLTYEQIVGAGALEASERPVKVAKYHAQTVRGGALGLIMLTDGPAAADQIEFVRELLVDIQGKFESTVRARLEAARRYEDELYRTRRDLEEGQVALQARSRAVAGIMDCVTAARSKMAVDAEAVHAQVRDFEGRESQLRDDRRALDEMSQQIEGLRGSLDARASDVDAREAKAREKHEGLDSREEGVRLRDAEVSGREGRLTEREAAVQRQADENARQVADISARETALAVEAERIERSRGEIDAQQSELAKLRETLDARAARDREEETLRAQEYEDWRVTLESERKILRQQKESFQKERADLRAEMAAHSQRLAEREREIAAREAKVISDIEFLGRREEEIRLREVAAEEARKDMEEQKAGLEAAQNEWGQRVADFDARQQRLRLEETRLAEESARKQQIHEASGAELEERREAVGREADARAQSVLAMRAEIDRKDQEARAREDRLSSLQESLRRHEEILVQERANQQAMARQSELQRLEADQARFKIGTENARLREELEALRNSAGGKGTESSPMRDWLLRDLAVREKAVSDRETWLRAKERELEMRAKKIELLEQESAA